jgi:hypothetical protein
VNTDPKNEPGDPPPIITRDPWYKLRLGLWFAAIFFPLNYILGHGEDLPKGERVILALVVCGVIFVVEWVRDLRRKSG